MTTLGELYREGKELLESCHIEDAALDAWLLLEFAAGIDRAHFLAFTDAPADPEAESKYREMTARRAAHEPLQYLTKTAPFYGRDFSVGPDVLIPRQDTEILVETALRLTESMQALRFLDLCTGSGCVGITLAAERPDAYGILTDISEGALNTAKRNAQFFHVDERVCFICSDFFSAPFFVRADGSFHLITANPPYIPSGELPSLMEEVRDHEPRLALDGGEDGLLCYRLLAEQAGRYLLPGGWLVTEIGADQGKDVPALYEKAGFADISCVKDLSGCDRVVCARRGGEAVF